MAESDFEKTIAELTLPLNGQYPRPWMTKLTDPKRATVFIVGKNQAKGYPVERVDAHKRHLDALFNRNGVYCRALYDEISGGSASKTRLNTDRFVCELAKVGVTEVIETNVICYSTPMSDDLRLKVHAGGAKRGEDIFRYLLNSINPRILIVHGADATRKLAGVLGAALSDPPNAENEVSCSEVSGHLVVVIPSLAPPAFNKWSSWSSGHFKNVAKRVADELRKSNN